MLLPVKTAAKATPKANLELNPAMILLPSSARRGACLAMHFIFAENS